MRGPRWPATSHQISTEQFLMFGLVWPRSLGVIFGALMKELGRPTIIFKRYTQGRGPLGRVGLVGHWG